LADRVVAFDPEERDRLLARCGGTARIEIVPIGIDTAAFAPSSRSARARFGLRAEEFAIVLRARPERRAGIDTAVGALAALRRDHDVAARLLVAAATDDFDTGARAEIARLRKLAVAAGVSGQVTFVPAASTTALREVYAAADAAVVLPEGPCEPATALEAMACGIPVVGADRGSLRWAMQDEVTGFLVPGGDAAAVAERLARLRRNPELGRAYGRAGIRRVRAGFTWRHAAGALAWIYAGVLAPHRARLAAAASR
jgi:glycosyltransferase involved in cell wall biosynthesis